MDIETIQYLMDVGQALQKIKDESFKMVEALEVPDGSGDFECFEELVEDKERMIAILYQIKEFTNNIDASLYHIKWEVL